MAFPVGHSTPTCFHILAWGEGGQPINGALGPHLQKGLWALSTSHSCGFQSPVSSCNGRGTLRQSSSKHLLTREATIRDLFPTGHTTTIHSCLKSVGTSISHSESIN